MVWIPKEREIQALLAADGKRRYEYFIHRVCDSRKVWSLYSDGWAALGEGSEKLLPLWPHEAYARLFVQGEWASFVPQAIELHEFLERWIPGLAKEGLAPAIFPVPSGHSVVVSLDDLAAHLKLELDEVYGEGEGDV